MKDKFYFKNQPHENETKMIIVMKKDDNTTQEIECKISEVNDVIKGKKWISISGKF